MMRMCQKEAQPSFITLVLRWGMKYMLCSRTTLRTSSSHSSKPRGECRMRKPKTSVSGSAGIFFLALRASSRFSSQVLTVCWPS